MRLGGWVKLAVVAVLVVVGGSLAYGWTQGRDARRWNDRANETAAELARSKLELAGIESLWATTTDDLVGDLELADDSLAGLARELEALGSELAALTRVAVGAQGTVETDATLVTDTTGGPAFVLYDSTLVAQSFYQDGPLSGELRYRFADERFQHGWRFDAEARVVHVRTPDSGILVGVETDDPRVHWRVREAVIDLPDPEDPGFPWLCAGTAFGSGGVVALKPEWWTAGAGALATLLAC